MRRLLHITLIILSLTIQFNLLGQEISTREELQLILSAEQLIEDLEDLMNEISNAETSPEERAFLMENSFSPGSRNQIFYDREIVIENDLDPSITTVEANEVDMSVKQYLNYFDLLYSKSSSPSVTFSDVDVITDIEKDQYYYLQISFTRSLNNAHKEINQAYKPTERIAEIRIDKAGNRWTTSIVGITFPKPEAVAPVQTPPQDNVANRYIPPANNLTENSFQFFAPYLGEKFKKGESINIRWEGPPNVDIPLELALVDLNGNETIIGQNIRSSSFNWNIPKKLSKGSYVINMYHATDNQRVGRSRSFQIAGGISPLATVGLFLLPPLAYGVFSIASDSDF